MSCAAWATLKKFFDARGLQGGMTSILHTWGSLTCSIIRTSTASLRGEVHKDGVWPVWTARDSQRTFFLSCPALSSVPCWFLAMLTSALKNERLHSAGTTQEVQEKGWVCSRPPAKGVNQVLEYIAAMLTVCNISNSRIKNYTSDGMVTYDWKDYRHNSVHKRNTMHAVEFLHLFRCISFPAFCPHPALWLALTVQPRQGEKGADSA